MAASEQRRRAVDLVASLEVTDRVLQALRGEPQTDAIVDLTERIVSQRDQLLVQVYGRDRNINR